MSLQNLGWNEHFQTLFLSRIKTSATSGERASSPTELSKIETSAPSGERASSSTEPQASRSKTPHPFRVIEEQRGRYKLAGEHGQIWAEVSGRLRHEASAGDDLPGVGDWVAAIQHSDDDVAMIVDRLERRTSLVRQAAGQVTRAQLIAANIDLVFVVTSCNEDMNPRRIERYLTLIWESGADVAIVLNKTDLCDNPQEYIDAIEAVAIAVPVYAVSAKDRSGFDQLEQRLAPGKTIAFVGSSGVGKSTLVNWLLGEETMAVGGIRGGDDHGRHTTSHRQLIPLAGDGGSRGVLIDTPGMRELQLWSDGDGLSQSFQDVRDLAEQCRFGDCGHMGEPGCAVTNAVIEGELTEERLSAFRKLEREVEWMEQRRDVSYKQAQRRRSKMIKRTQALRARLRGKPPTSSKG